MDCLVVSKSLRLVKGHEVPGGVAICEMVGGKLEAERGLMESGGGGTNVSVGLHRLGEAVKTVIRIGGDDVGELMTKQLKREDVDLSMVQKGNGNTGLSTVLVAANGGRSIVTYRGESELLDANKIDWEEMKKADWIQLSSLGGNTHLLEDIVSFAIENGIRIGINPGRQELAQRDSLLRLVSKFDFFNVNRQEASMLLGHNFEDEQVMMKKMADMGIRIVAVTDGKRGASILTNRQWIKMDATTTKSVDDTGAGDAFVSGVVAGILQEKKPEECLKMGLANGGSVVAKLGAKEGLLYKGDMEKWVSKKIKMTEEWV
ncbi:MAG: PfkB family kinase [Microgenomates group bacterium GW2011_GWC1_44_9]|nr:MAG: PfkB family kinase [Microgenomates group bacterium GW2011_GWC1_44_9]